jgi:hypothetical protein
MQRIVVVLSMMHQSRGIDDAFATDAFATDAFATDAFAAGGEPFVTFNPF